MFASVILCLGGLFWLLWGAFVAGFDASDLLACLEVISFLGFLVVLVSKVYYSILTFATRK